MDRIMKILAVLVAPLVLAGCLFLPGKFDATLKLDKGGDYEFTYVGEMQIFAGDGKDMTPPKLTPFNPEYAQCKDRINASGKKYPSTYYDRYGAEAEIKAQNEPAVADAAADAVEAVEAVSDSEERTVKRACTAKELTDLEQREADRYKRRKEDYDQRSGMVAQMFGGAIPGNDEALEKFAVKLLKYDGWNKVEYIGENKFNVEYSASGTFDRYFAFPILNDASMQYPFFQIVPRKSGELEVITPAVGGSNSFLAMAMMGGMRGSSKDMPMSEISGSFTLETDGEVLANNAPDGYKSADGTKTMRWDVKDLSESPRALIKID